MAAKCFVAKQKSPVADGPLFFCPFLTTLQILNQRGTSHEIFQQPAGIATETVRRRAEI